MCANISEEAGIIGDAEFGHCFTFLTGDGSAMTSKRHRDLGDRVATYEHSYHFRLSAGQPWNQRQIAGFVPRLGKRFDDGMADVDLPPAGGLNRLLEFIYCFHFSERADNAD